MHLDRLASALGAALLTVAGGLAVFLVSGECRKAGRLSPGRVSRPAIG